MSEYKEPVAKLGLAVRKDIRDNWDTKKPEFETKLSTLLGAPWTISFDPLSIYPYAVVGTFPHNAFGDCLSAYAKGAVNNVEDYVRTHGDSGKEEINSVGPAHTITMVASTTVKYSGCDFESGNLRLLFNPGELGCNIDDAFSKLATAVNDAPRKTAPSMSFAARHNISKTFTPQIVSVLAEAAKLLENPDLKFEPEFEGIYKGLKNGGSDVRSDWEANLGDFTVLYFKGFLYTLNRDKFGQDEMLREGFAEAAPAGIIKLRVVDKLSSGYNEILIEDGALVIQTTPDNWGVNIDDATSKLIDLL